MGAQPSDPDEDNYDPQALPWESPVHAVALSPFFLSEFEMTQGQWISLTGRKPSSYQQNELASTLLHPVEQISWQDCMVWLHRIGLILPSEAQWEYGARGQTGTPWWTGAERESLRAQRAANLADQSAARAGTTWSAIEAWPDLDDGYAVHAPVGVFSANPFGLHDTAGNVWEWCPDGYDVGFYSRSPTFDPVCPPRGFEYRVFRGGSFYAAATNARSANRNSHNPTFASHSLGVRPVRAIDP